MSDPDNKTIQLCYPQSQTMVGWFHYGSTTIGPLVLPPLLGIHRNSPYITPTPVRLMDARDRMTFQTQKSNASLINGLIPKLITPLRTQVWRLIALAAIWIVES